MRNKLPILLALILMAVAAMPWLRSLESQRGARPTGATTVPPPEQAGSRQFPLAQRKHCWPKDHRFQSPWYRPRDHPLAPQAQGKDLSQGNGNSSSKSPAEGSRMSRIADTSQSTPPKPQALLDSAVRAVETRHFISARIKQQGELFGHQITGEGRYYEVRRGTDSTDPLELTAEVGSVSTSLVQVCNGATLWTYRKLPNGESLSKIDAVRAITALEQAAGKLPREAIASSPGLGGLGRLMRGLNAQFEFTSVVADQLGGLPVWKLSGGWKPAQLARLLPNQKEAIEKGRPPDLTRLPGHLPDSVTLFLGQEDCFPFRIDYLRSVPQVVAALFDGPGVLRAEFQRADRLRPIPLPAGQFGDHRPHRGVCPLAGRRGVTVTSPANFARFAMLRISLNFGPFLGR